MTQQKSLFDADTPVWQGGKPASASAAAQATAQRDAALEQVEAASDPEWRDRALEAIRRTCLALETFIGDDVWTVGELDRPRESRALGPVILEAARRGWCVRTDRMRPSVQGHMCGRPVWRSLLRGGLK